MSLSNTAILEFFPGEEILSSLLQSTLQIRINNKNIRVGRLIHFKRIHYVYCLVFLNSKDGRETLEIPIPFNIEMYKDEKLIYFDYRVKTFTNNNADIQLKVNKIKTTNSTTFYDKIVEIEYK
jgi:hypothetical protein